jgi:hypothetical protein
MRMALLCTCCCPPVTNTAISEDWCGIATRNVRCGAHMCRGAATTMTCSWGRRRRTLTRMHPTSARPVRHAAACSKRHQHHGGTATQQLVCSAGGCMAGKRVVSAQLPPSSLRTPPAAAIPSLSASAACASLRPWGRASLAQGPCWSDGLSVMQTSRALIQTSRDHHWATAICSVAAFLSALAGLRAGSIRGSVQRDWGLRLPCCVAFAVGTVLYCDLPVQLLTTVLVNFTI